MARVTFNRVGKDGEQGNRGLRDTGRVQLRTEDIREVFEGGLWSYSEFHGPCTWVKLELDPGADSAREYSIKEDFDTVTAMIAEAEAAEEIESTRKRNKPTVLKIPKS